jgi:hypothetical protein
VCASSSATASTMALPSMLKASSSVLSICKTREPLRYSR